MGLMDRFSTGFHLMKASARFVSHEKDLVVYPVLTALTYVAILLFVVGGVFGGLIGLEFLGISADEITDGQIEFASYIVLFVYYALVATATTFFSSALVYCSIERFRGKKVGITDGLKRAWTSKWTIFKYGLVSAFVGVILRVIERKFKNAGKILSFLGGVAWAVATFFIVPVILYSQQDNLREMIKDSAVTFKNLWGETASATLGLELFLFVFLMVVGIPSLGVILLLPMLTVPVLVLYGAVFLVSLAFYQVAAGVIKSSLYVYAMTGRMPEDFRDVNSDDLATLN